MWLRRAFFLWMFPAAVVLPLWLLIGWIAFDANAWALVPVLFLAMPAVLLAQLMLALLVRLRGSVRAERAVSWWDVLGFGVWHALIVVSGLYPAGYGAVLLAALAAVFGVFWLVVWQLWREAAAGVRTVLRAADATAFPGTESRGRARSADADVVVISESRPRA